MSTSENETTFHVLTLAHDAICNMYDSITWTHYEHSLATNISCIEHEKFIRFGVYADKTDWSHPNNKSISLNCQLAWINGENRLLLKLLMLLLLSVIAHLTPFSPWLKQNICSDLHSISVWNLDCTECFHLFLKKTLALQ